MQMEYVKDHRDYLKRELKQRSSRRPLYSQRAFARDLGLSPSTLVEYLNGKLMLSVGRVSMLSKKMGLSNEQKQHWMDLITSTQAKDNEKKRISGLRVEARFQAQKSNLTVSEFQIISDWYHFAFLELVEMNPEKYSSLSVSAKALGIPLKTLQAGVQRLRELNLLIADDKGGLKACTSTQISDQAPSLAIRTFHSQILQKALTAVEMQTVNKRFCSSTMIALPKDKIQEIIKELGSLAFKVLEPYIQNDSSILIKNERTELYCLGIQFFDLLTTSESMVATSGREK